MTGRDDAAPPSDGLCVRNWRRALCRGQRIPMMYMVILLTGALLGSDLLDIAARLRTR